MKLFHIQGNTILSKCKMQPLDKDFISKPVWLNNIHEYTSFYK